MYLVVIAWIYVVLMMSVAEATNTTGSVLGAIMTFVLYGVLPIALVVYLMGTPARRRALKQKEAEEMKSAAAAAAQAGGQPFQEPAAHEPSAQPDAGGHASGSEQSGRAQG